MDQRCVRCSDLTDRSGTDERSFSSLVAWKDQPTVFSNEQEPEEEEDE